MRSHQMQVDCCNVGHVYWIDAELCLPGLLRSWSVSGWEAAGDTKYGRWHVAARVCVSWVDSTGNCWCGSLKAEPILHQSLPTLHKMLVAYQRRAGIGMGGYKEVNLDGSVGRPPFIMLWKQSAHLLMMCFTVPQISGILGFSVRTVKR